MVLPGNFSSGFSAFGGAVFSENWVASAVVFSEKSNAPVVSFFKSAASKTGAVPKFPGRAKPSAGGFSKFLELEKPRSFSAVFFSKFGWAKTPGLFSVKFFGKTAGADCATGDPFLTAAGGATEMPRCTGRQWRWPARWPRAAGAPGSRAAGAGSSTHIPPG